jgi:hypothetical protein
MREEKAEISEKALVKVSVDLDAKCLKIEATHQEYFHKIRAHTNCAKNTLSLEKMLGEKKVQLNKKERDLTLQEAVLTEPQAWVHNPWDNLEELTELVELQKRLDEAEVVHITKAG